LLTFDCSGRTLDHGNDGFCIIEILVFMYALGIVIDSVSIINIVLAVGLSVDFSAHVGHCFMLKGGKSKDDRATEVLAVSTRSSAYHHFIHVSVTHCTVFIGLIPSRTLEILF
jgi:multidrug efflux pump subunit AcrB